MTATPSDTALAFAATLVAGDYAAALAMLSPALKRHYSKADLQKQLAQMLAYTGESATGADVAVETVMEDWPDKLPDDALWAYVSIAKSSFAEAVTVIVDARGDIREIIWGRP
jgi:hypothetical protein